MQVWNLHCFFWFFYGRSYSRVQKWKWTSINHFQHEPRMRLHDKHSTPTFQNLPENVHKLKTIEYNSRVSYDGIVSRHSWLIILPCKTKGKANLSDKRHNFKQQLMLLLNEILLYLLFYWRSHSRGRFGG